MIPAAPLPFASGTISVQVPAATVAMCKAMCEILAGTVDGKNTKFSIAESPMTNTQLIFRNGLALFPGAGDYLIQGNQIAFNFAPQPGDALICFYWAQPD